MWRDEECFGYSAWTVISKGGHHLLVDSHRNRVDGQ